MFRQRRNDLLQPITYEGESLAEAIHVEERLMSLRKDMATLQRELRLARLARAAKRKK